MKYNNEILFGVGIAISLLLNGFTSPPYNSVDINVNEFSFPLFSLIFIICNKERPKIFKTEMLIIIPLLLSYFINIDFGSKSWLKIGFHFIVGLVILSKLHNRKKMLNFVKGFLYTFAALCFLIYVYRFNKYDGDIIRIRSGINIWGGNVLFIMSLLGAIIGIKNEKKFFRVCVAIAAISAIMFINRMAIVLSILIIFFLLSFRWKIFIIMSLSFLYPSFRLISKEYALAEAIALRFSGSNPTATREHIWNEAISIFLNQPITGVGLGSYRIVGSQTSAHSLPLNVLAESGFIFGGMILVYFLLNYVIIFANSYNRIGFIVLMLYSSVILTMSIAGEKLIQASGYGNALILVLLILSVRTFSNNQDRIHYGSQSI